MRPHGGAADPSRLVRAFRIGWAFLSVGAVETTIFALATLPGILLTAAVLSVTEGSTPLRVVLVPFIFVPAYVVFAIGLMVYSALVVRALNWRAGPGQAMPIRSLGWPLLRWVRGLVLQHFVRIFAGHLFRSSPLWTFYLRLNGARLGKDVYVNSLSIMDHHLISVGDGSVIGSDVHMSGHWVDHGVVRTESIVIGSGVTIGINAVVGIGVTIEDGVQVGALSVVPKYAHLKAGKTYVGAPARELARSSDSKP
ncbi:MAG: hypothetical protein HKO53_12430 [Gemmatimonadetes bacterium]|nr:hypothetical protein [Gemmatimonadota bacterium]NNM33871.1 hypothetical protein [Gemmatimonadota bacterium]